MNSAAPPVVDPVTEPAWENVRRLQRRICLLRATGRPAEALDLEIGELPQAIADARAAEPAYDRADAIRDEETRRISDAITLAEVLAPLLAEKLRQHPPVAVVDGLPAPSRPPEPRRPAGEFAAEHPATASAPSIADFIDTMLAQRPGSSATHRS